jgi:hypothetical protein
VRACLDDLVIARYVTIEDLLGPRRGPGHPPKLSDAELDCLAVPRSCSVPALTVTGSALSVTAWGTCSPLCPVRSATTSGCAALLTTSGWPSATWPWPRRRGVRDGPEIVGRWRDCELVLPVRGFACGGSG